MTTIATIEELEAVPEGGTIRVLDPRNGRKQFTRCTDGFLSEHSITLPLDLFTTALAASAVEAGPVFTVGQVFTIGSYYEWFVIAVEEDGRALVLKVYEKQYIEALDHEAVLPESAVTTTDLDERHRALLSAGEFMRQQRRLTERAEQRMQTLQENHDARIQRITEYVHDAMAAFDDDDDVSRMRDALDSAGLDLPSQSVDFEITVSGSTEVETDSATARTLMGGDGITIDEATTTVSWTRKIEVEEEYNGTNGDPCEDRNFIDLDWVRRHLDDMDVSYDYHSLNIESRSCSHC